MKLALFTPAPCFCALAGSLLVLGLGFTVSAGGPAYGPQPAPGAVPKAPPPAPPIQSRSLPPENRGPERGPQPLYSIGQPTDEEQLYLEYLNRMRADPTGEGQRLATTTDPDVLSAYSYFQVDLSLMQSEFSTNPPVPPLAMNAQLLAAARWHSGDMFTNSYQGHDQNNGSVVLDPGDRITAMGYTWATYGENVFSYADSVFYGHAGFAVDWGPGVGGMQNPPGHRNNMFSSNFREVGIGVVDGVNGTVGPQLVTQDFATQHSSKPFITGVVYYDFNGNGFYDIGEGIGGVLIAVPGTSFSCVTADSGGYAFPVTTNGSYLVTFSAPALAAQAGAAVSNQKNVKLDYLPVYSPPVIAGPNPAFLNQTNLYSFSPVGGATSYQWLQATLAPYTAVEGAENGLNNVTVSSSPDYTVLNTDLVSAGAYSFHLAQPTPPTDQSVTLNAVILPGAASVLSFDKLLGWAGSSQVARAQVSTNAGASWVDVWSQPGSNGSGDPDFSAVQVSLGAFAGQNLKVRFVYDYTGGSYFYQTDPGVGLYLDNISVSNASQLQSQVTNTVAAGTSFPFYPTTSATYRFQVRAQINSRTLNWGPAFTAGVSSAPPSIRLGTSPSFAAGQFQLDFTVANYQAGMTFQLLKAADPSGSWAVEPAASLQTLVPNSQFRFTVPGPAAAQMFYRVKAN